MNLNEQDTLKMKGELQVVVRGEDGNIKQEFTVPNLVVSAGKTYIASRMTTGATTVMSHMAIGTSSTTAIVGDTTLGVEAGRVTLTSFSASTNTVTATATFPAGTGTGGIQEAGILNASTAGTLLCRTVFPIVNKAAGDSIAITWVVTVS